MIVVAIFHGKPPVFFPKKNGVAVASKSWPASWPHARPISRPSRSCFWFGGPGSTEKDVGNMGKKPMEIMDVHGFSHGFPWIFMLFPVRSVISNWWTFSLFVLVIFVEIYCNGHVPEVSDVYPIIVSPLSP